jgi:hypothetical protein
MPKNISANIGKSTGIHFRFQESSSHKTQKRPSRRKTEREQSRINRHVGNASSTGRQLTTKELYKRTLILWLVVSAPISGTYAKVQENDSQRQNDSQRLRTNDQEGGFNLKSEARVVAGKMLNRTSEVKNNIQNSPEYLGAQESLADVKTQAGEMHNRTYEVKDNIKNSPEYLGAQESLADVKTEGRVVADKMRNRTSEVKDNIQESLAHGKTKGKVVADKMRNRTSEVKDKIKNSPEYLGAQEILADVKTESRVVAGEMRNRTSEVKDNIQKTRQYINIDTAFKVLENSTNKRSDDLLDAVNNTPAAQQIKRNFSNNTEPSPTPEVVIDDDKNCAAITAQKLLRYAGKTVGSSCLKLAATTVGQFTGSKLETIIPPAVIEKFNNGSKQGHESLTHIMRNATEAAIGQAQDVSTATTIAVDNSIDFMQERLKDLKETTHNITVEINKRIKELADISNQINKVINKTSNKIDSIFNNYNVSNIVEFRKQEDKLRFKLEKMENATTTVIDLELDNYKDVQSNDTFKFKAILLNHTQDANDSFYDMKYYILQLGNNSYIQISKEFFNTTATFYNTIKELPDRLDMFLDNLIKLDFSTEYSTMLLLSSISMLTTIYICYGNRKQIALRKIQKDIMKRSVIALSINTVKEKKPKQKNKKKTEKILDEEEGQLLLNADSDRRLLQRKQEKYHKLRNFLEQGPRMIQDIYEFGNEI